MLLKRLVGFGSNVFFCFFLLGFLAWPWLCSMFFVCCFDAVVCLNLQYGLRYDWKMFLFITYWTVLSFSLSQVLAQLLFRRADSDQHWWSAWALHSLWNHLSVSKLFCWCLCLLKFDWTGIWCDDVNIMSSSPYFQAANHIIVLIQFSCQEPCWFIVMVLLFKNIRCVTSLDVTDYIEIIYRFY